MLEKSDDSAQNTGVTQNIEDLRDLKKGDADTLAKAIVGNASFKIELKGMGCKLIS